MKYALNEGRKMDLKAMAINQYDNLVISKVNNYLNVRAEPKSDGKIIGKMTSKAAGEILESLDGWYKIKSGPITGYITADPQYTATGQEAKDIAMQTATLRAVINTDVLNVRTEPNTDAKIWTQIVKDERYPVLAQLDGWVQIELDSVDEEDGSEGDKAYISTRDNNVEVRYALNEAIKFSPAEEAANAAASRRSKVVNYALQFVGNPYVWGGTSLTKGADCSGFTMQVMKQFGVSLPHYSGAQAKMGKPVKSSDASRRSDLLRQQRRHGQPCCHVHRQRPDRPRGQQEERNQDFHLELPHACCHPQRAGRLTDSKIAKRQCLWLGRNPQKPRALALFLQLAGGLGIIFCAPIASGYACPI